MTEPGAGGAAVLAALARRWHRRRVVAAGLTAAALLLPLGAVLLGLPAPGPWGARAGLVAAAAIALLGSTLRLARRPAPGAAIAAHLDRRLPELAESSELLLAAEPLPPLAALQRRRLESTLAALDPAALRTVLPVRGLRRAVAMLAAGAVAAATVLTLRPSPLPADAAGTRGTAVTAAGAAPAPATPLLRELRVTVQPPTYTGRPTRTGARLGTSAEEGAIVEWRLRTAASVDAAWLLLDETARLPLRRSGDTHVVARRVREPQLVRLVLAAGDRELWRSAPARLEVVPDRPPEVELVHPEALVERFPDELGPLPVAFAVSDDYGIAAGELLLTVASGEGEQVETRESRAALPLARGGGRQVVRQELDLASLALVPGSDLYVRAEVRDNRRPQAHATRSPTLIVRVPLVQAASVDLGAGLPALVGPELLRSQRQIVIDTEALVAAAPRLAAAELDRRSRAIALDQRALRLRYGVLLGQEVEDGTAIEADEDHAGAGDEGAGHGGEGLLQGVPEGLAHSHDSAESATFFPDPVRRQLVAMLGAMWEAERELATIAPRAALPHERRALELLKAVQQASRVYVRRLASETTPLDPARRLGGELADARDVASRAAGAPSDLGATAAASLLAALAAGEHPRAGLTAAVRPPLLARARRGDDAALAALAALDAAEAGTLSGPARQSLLQALWQLLPPPELPPRREVASDALWRRYRRELGEDGR